MNIRKINAVKLGVCNFLSGEQANDLFNNIKEYTKFITKEKAKDNPDVKDLDTIASYLSGVLKLWDSRLDFKNLQNPNISSSSEEEDYLNYSSASNRAYEYQTINELYPIYYDKKYTLSRDDYHREHAFYNAITLIEGVNPNLVHKMRTKRTHDKTELNLSELLDYLHIIGKKNIVIIDLSCSISDNITSRNFRGMDRSDMGFGGKKTNKF